MCSLKKVLRFSSLLSLALFFLLAAGVISPFGQLSLGPDTLYAAGDGGNASSSLSAEKIKDLGWRIVNFIALMIILVYFGAKPIGKGLAARRQRITDEISSLEEKKRAAERSYNEFQAKLAGVEGEIDKIVERAVAQAEIEKAKILEKAEQAAEDIKRAAAMAIQNEVTEARRTLKNEVAEQAAALAEAIIIENLKADDQVKIIKNYLEKVGAVQ